MAESDFNELLHAAEQLSAEVDGSGELPKVERTLRQVLEASTELWSRVTQTGAQDIQAHLLLGSKGVDLPQLSQKLEVLSTRKTFEPLEPVCDADVQSFLKNELENALLSIIEETHLSTFDDTEKMMFEDIDRRWKREKRNALNALMGSSDEYMELTFKPEISVINDSVSSGPKSLLDHQEMAYAKILTDYNKVVVQGGVRSSLVDKFVQSTEISNDKKVRELWEMIRYMVQIPPRAKGTPLEARNTPEVIEALVSQAKLYLQDRYKLFMVSKVEGNLQKARRGGSPGTLPLVISFVKMCAVEEMAGLEDGLVEGQPLWPLVYYCLRCGDVAAAMHCSRQAGDGMEEFTSVLDELRKSKDHKLSARREQYVHFHYQRHVRGTTDPFKKAVYCVIGACDSSEEHSIISKTADDYLWLKLSQIRESASTDSIKRGKMNYTHLQSLISEEYGEKHYNALEQPLLYFQMLFLSGQFETAIEFLARMDKLRVHALHVAITLNEHNLLAVPANIQAPLLSVEPSDTPPAKRLNLARLVMLFVRKFEHSDTKEALQYYYFLRNMETPEGRNLFMLCISDLVMDTRNFKLVLGEMAPDGCRIPGLIDSFHGVQADVKQIIEIVASEAERKGLFEDAICLYDLANNHEKVLTLMSTMLSQVVHHEDTPGTLRCRLQNLAYDISNRYMGQQFQCFSDTASKFFVLRDLLAFFDQYHARDHQQALETIGRSKLIPMGMDELEERVNNFRHLADEVCRSLPDVLLATMNILRELYIKAKGGECVSPSGGRLEEHSKEKQLSYLREKARAITSFAGTVPYHMPGDTNARLVQMEILMN